MHVIKHFTSFLHIPFFRGIPRAQEPTETTFSLSIEKNFDILCTTLRTHSKLDIFGAPVAFCAFCLIQNRFHIQLAVIARRFGFQVRSSFPCIGTLRCRFYFGLTRRNSEILWLPCGRLSTALCLRFGLPDPS